MYEYTIQYSHLPCLQVGNQKKVNYLPMEVGTCQQNFNVFLFIAIKSSFFSCDSCFQACKRVEGQRYTKELFFFLFAKRYTKELNEKQITSLLKVSCQRPHEQEADILPVHVYFK